MIGRRWGKTFFGVGDLADDALDACAAGRGPADYGWIAPSYHLSNNGWREFDQWFRPIEIARSKSERWVQLICGCKIWFLSATGAVRGHGFRKIVIDEGAWILKRTYEEVILPTVADWNGPILILTTPAGRRGWVWEEYCRAVNGEPGYGYLKRPSTDNPNPNIRKFIEGRRQRMDPRAFEQEFLAEFVEDAAALFRNLDHAIGGVPEAPAPQMSYLSGADLGKSQAWTVQYTARINHHPFQVVHEDRFQLMDWPDQVRRAKGNCDRYNAAPLVVDATGVGDAVLSMMREAGITARGVKILPAGQPTGVLGKVRRKDLLDNLAIRIDRGDFRVPAEYMGPDTPLRVELESFAVDVDDEGRTKYRSRGGNSDCVFGLALLAHGLPPISGPGLTVGRLTEEQAEDVGGDPILDEEF